MEMLKETLTLEREIITTGKDRDFNFSKVERVERKMRLSSKKVVSKVLECKHNDTLKKKLKWVKK